MTDVEIVYSVPGSFRFREGSGDEFGQSNTFAVTVQDVPLVIEGVGRSFDECVAMATEMVTKLMTTDKGQWFTLPQAGWGMDWTTIDRMRPVRYR